MSENKKHLANVRVVQKNLVFVVGLSPRLSDPEVSHTGAARDRNRSGAVWPRDDLSAVSVCELRTSPCFTAVSFFELRTLPNEILITDCFAVVQNVFR